MKYYYIYDSDTLRYMTYTDKQPKECYTEKAPPFFNAEFEFPYWNTELNTWEIKYSL